MNIDDVTLFKTAKRQLEEQNTQGNGDHATTKGASERAGAVCIFDFVTEEEGKISIQVDEQLYVIEDFSDGWTKVVRTCVH